MTAFDVTKIQNYAAKNVNKIIGLILLGLKAADQISVYQNIKEETGLTTFKSGNLGQPYRLAFEPKNNVLSFGYRTLLPKMGKLDLEIAPLQFSDTWLVALTKPGVNQYDLPYEMFFWEQIALKLASEINQQSVYSGVYNGAGTTTLDIVTGFGKLFADEITAGNLTQVVATGAITNANALAKFRSMAKALPAAYRDVMTMLYCSYNNYDNYCENYQSANGHLPYNTQYEKITMDGFPNTTIVPASWLNSSGRLILTPKENIVMGTDSLSDLNKIETVNQIRVIQAAIHFRLCYQIADLDSLWINDQA